MNFTPSFYRFAAVCSVLTAATTLCLIFLPDFYQPVEGFAGRMSRVHEPAYRLRSWIYLLHPFLVLLAALAVAMRIRRLASAAAVIGLLGFSLWGFTEAGQQTLTLFAFDRWREGYAAADAATRAAIETNSRMYDGLWDAMYFLLLLGFSIGNLCLGVALVRHPGFTRAVGGFFLAAALLTLSIIAGELRWEGFGVPEWVYPVLQPLGRLLIGWWLWIAADEAQMLPRTLRVEAKAGTG